MEKQALIDCAKYKLALAQKAEAQAIRNYTMTKTRFNARSVSRARAYVSEAKSRLDALEDKSNE